jgi:6-phosphogluconate dehydrogenase
VIPSNKDTSTVDLDSAQSTEESRVERSRNSLNEVCYLSGITLAKYTGRVSDSGEGRWTLIAAIDEGVPAPVLNAAVNLRFASRGAEDFANKLLSAMRMQFGGHEEQHAEIKS